MSKIQVGVVGYGYWGPNVARNLASIPGVHLAAICDRKPAALKNAKRRYPSLQFSRNARDITGSKTIDAVAVVTPVSTHYEIVRHALLNGKHVFVEKPFTANVRQAETLVALAEKKRLKIMVDHTFIYTGAVKKIKELVDQNALGNIFYYDSTRVNLGLFQHDVNVIWDLIPHDLSVMDYVLKDRPVAVSAQGMDHFGRGRENIAYVTVYFESKMIAHFNVNWLSPVKIRSTLIGGSKKMLVWNDLEADENIKVYNKGVNLKGKTGVYNLLVSYRSGDMWAPRLDHKEALLSELEHFAEVVRTNKKTANDGRSGLRIVRLLEATDRSLKKGGKLVRLSS